MKLIVLLVCALLTACASTPDASVPAELAAMVRDLNGPEMNAAIHAAQPGVPRAP